MCVYLQTKFQVYSIIVTSFRQEVVSPLPPPATKKTPKKSTQIKVNSVIIPNHISSCHHIRFTSSLFISKGLCIVLSFKFLSFEKDFAYSVPADYSHFSILLSSWLSLDRVSTYFLFHQYTTPHNCNPTDTHRATDP